MPHGPAVAGVMAVAAALGTLSCRPAHALALEGYPSEQSVVQGDTLDLHVRCQEPYYQVTFWRQGTTLDFAGEMGIFSGQDFPLPPESWANGCGWPVTCRLPIPPTCAPGAYLARLKSPGRTAWVPFVVRAQVPGSWGAILLVMATNTWQAYNRYGGKSLYVSLLPDNPGRSSHVSFHRPYNFPTTDGSGSFFAWEAPFMSFLESNGYAYEVCTSVDLHRQPGLLTSYSLMLCVGHDEYWSKEQFDAAEQFVDDGGNLAIFSGNTLWWQVRFENGEHSMVCYRQANLDPLLGIDNPRVTVNWFDWPVLRPPVQLMGVCYNGSYGITPGGYQVVDPTHWAFRGVAVDSGQTFGDPMVAFEIDGMAPNGPPRLDRIAHTERPDMDNGGILRPADMVYYERTPEYGFPGGRGGGVFAGGTTDFVQGLVPGYNLISHTTGVPDTVAIAITRNVLDRLACDLRGVGLTSPEDGGSVLAPEALLQWHAAHAAGRGLPVLYTVFWERDGGGGDSLETADTSLLVTVSAHEHYRWWVSASADCGSRIATAPRTFWTRDPTDSLPMSHQSRLTLQHRDHRILVEAVIQESAWGEIRLFDVAGRLVHAFPPHLFGPEPTTQVWELAPNRPLANGIYFVRLQAASHRLQQKVVVRR